MFKERKVSYCNISDGYRAEVDNFDRKGEMVHGDDYDNDGFMYRTMDMYIR